MPLKVIGAGLPRTGTSSQKLALEHLGFGPCYHMREMMGRPQDWPIWIAAMEGKPVDWRALMDEWGSTTDAPGCHFWRELMEVYADAPVILSVRDPEAWFASTQNTILQPVVVEMHRQLGTLPAVDAMNWGSDPRLHDKGFMLERYHRHNAEVLAGVPKDRLLVYDAREGWEPLCKFLGVPAPDIPFPETNTTPEFRSRLLERAAETG